MSDDEMNFSETSSIELTSIQREVIEILGMAKSRKYPLGDWYLGAIYAAKNTHNPDRFSQAAQSLRELLEKLPRVFIESEVQESRHDLRTMRSNLYSRLSSDKTRYEDGWRGKNIDASLDKTIRGMDRYLELNQLPERKDQIHSVMNKLDPMHDTLGQEIRTEKSRRFHSLWKIFEGLAHHKTSGDEMYFWDNLASAERLIIDLLAPVTAQDQKAIHAIISKPQFEQDDVEELFELIKRRGANYAFFFKSVDSPAWLSALAQDGFFSNPPNVEAAGDGRIIAPLWLPIFYLQRIAAKSPEQVVDIILGLEKTDNPRILREIFSIACDLPAIGLSLRLKPVIKRFLQSDFPWGEAELIVRILEKWGCEPGPARNAAYEIVQHVVAFQPDPKEDEKRSRRKEKPDTWNTSLEPVPRFDEWEYQQILEKGIRPLAEKEPYQIARILISATANMIQMGIYKEELDKELDEDYSEIWCCRLDKPTRDYQDIKETLVHTLTYACEQVYGTTPEFIEELDQILRKQQWKLFSRLRQQLYASHPNDQTLPWIRELILGRDDYSKWEYHYEFQMMIRKASEDLGTRLLSDSELLSIYDAIRSGPQKEEFREWMGESFSEDAFQQRQHYFHRLQLRPFATLLTGEHRRYFDDLEGEAHAETITDDSYPPYKIGDGGIVSYRSPKSAEDLGSFTDEELLTYLNDWNEEHRDKENWLVEINISALAGMFQSLFKEQIVPDGERLAYWMANRDKIARPIYCSAMVEAMQELVKEKNFGNLGQWIEFCAWVLSHPDSEKVEGQPGRRDQSRDHPDWVSSRRAVVDFIDTCLDIDVDVPIATREGLGNLFQEVCLQFDWRLDRDRPVLLNRDNPITEAVNNTRSRALRSLVSFGFWIRRHLPNDPVLEVTDTISKRMPNVAEFPLTRPERALLGMQFRNLCILNRDWAIEQRKALFPQDDASVWRVAFGSYLRFNRPFKAMFEILRGDFVYALNNLNVLTTIQHDREELVDRLGQQLFTYYLWQLYPLVGDQSLLGRFYEKTNNDRQRWARLFDHVGRLLRNSDKILDKELIDRIIAYFDWRLAVAEPLELQKYTFWLEAECLDPEWRLRSYSKILDFGRGNEIGLSLEVRALNKLLPDHLMLVIECFAKITGSLDQRAQPYMLSREAKPILMAGLNAGDPLVREKAERARENLFRSGRFDILDIN